MLYEYVLQIVLSNRDQTHILIHDTRYQVCNISSLVHFHCCCRMRKTEQRTNYETAEIGEEKVRQGREERQRRKEERGERGGPNLFRNTCFEAVVYYRKTAWSVRGKENIAHKETRVARCPANTTPFLSHVNGGCDHC